MERRVVVFRFEVLGIRSVGLSIFVFLDRKLPIGRNFIIFFYVEEFRFRVDISLFLNKLEYPLCDVRAMPEFILYRYLYL